jgi:hypothetical protein
VFSEHVTRVAEVVSRLGKRPQYWCDPHPNEDDGLPRDLVALVWGYEDDTDFATRISAHRAVGRDVWVAPGTSCWNSSTGRTWNRRGNLDKAAAETRAAGFLCTIWGDGGHRQGWPITLFGCADAAMAAWSGPGRYDDRAAGLHAFGSPELGVWLARLGDADRELCLGQRPGWDGTMPAKRQCRNTTALWREMHTNLFEQQGLGDAAAWHEVAGRLAELRASLPAGSDPLVADECGFAVELGTWTADRAVMRRAGPEIQARKALAGRMADLIATHRRLWLARSRYGGLEESCAHYVQRASQW